MGVVKFSHIEVKVVRDNQSMLGTGPLPDQLRNLARGSVSKLVSLDSFNANLCLQRCIAVYRGAQPDRSTQAARELAKNFFKFRTAPNNIPRTSLDELEKVERHLSQELPLSDWLGIRVHEPERQKNSEILWQLRKNLSDKLKNILTIGIYDGHAFFIRRREASKTLRKC